VGALLLLGFAWTVLDTLAALSRGVSLTGIATFAAVLVIALTGWWLWQPWLIGAFDLASVALAVASVRVGNRERDAQVVALANGPNG
jgi:hypothetical protein